MQGGRALENWEPYFAPLRSLLDQLAAILARAPAMVGIAVLLLPVVLAAVARRLPTILGALLLAIMAGLMLGEPTRGAATIAIGLYLASLIVAMSGIARRRRDRAVQAELASLHSEMNQVLGVQSRQLITELNRPRANPPEARDPPKQPGGVEPHGERD